jgi:hypothetical protein
MSLTPSRSRVIPLLVSVAVLLVTLPGAQAAQSRRIPVANDGALEIQLPDGWVADVQGGGASSPPTVQVTAPGHDFAMTVAPVAIPAGAGSPSPERVRAAVERMAGSPEIKERADNPQVPIQDLGGPSRAGYYFSVTDKTWKPGSEDYHYMTQGALVVGNVAVNFIFLSNSVPGADHAAALDLLRSARPAP